MKKFILKSRSIRRKFQVHLKRIVNEYFPLEEMELNYNYEDDYTPCTDRSEC